MNEQWDDKQMMAWRELQLSFLSGKDAGYCLDAPELLPCGGFASFENCHYALYQVREPLIMDK